MWKLITGLAAITILTLLFTTIGPGSHRLEAGNPTTSRNCDGTLTVTFNAGDHPVTWPLNDLESGELGAWTIDIAYDGDAETPDPITITGPPPVIPVQGTVDGEGIVQAFGEGTYADISTSVDFNGLYLGDPTEDGKLTGEFSVDPEGELFGNPINYELSCQPPPPEKKYSIHALKIDDAGDPIPGWLMTVYGGDCDDEFAPIVDSGFTGDDGFVDFYGLQAGTYSVEEEFDSDWNPVTPPCVEVEFPGVAGVAGDEFIACPNADPNSCDSFDSGALVNVGIVGSDELFGVTLNGPTVIKRSDVVSGALDSVQTEIIQLDLAGTSAALGDIHVTLASRPDSTGKITEQQNSSAELDFPADSFFDIFFEVELDGATLHNEEPLHLECKIEEIPPEFCAYEPPIPEPIQLFNDDGVKVAFIDHAMHIPLPPNGRLVVFENEFKDDVTPTPTINPSFAEKIDVCIDAQVIEADPAIWSKAQIDALVEGADDIWSPANINISWNNDVADIEDPNTDVGDVGDIIDTFKDDEEFLALGENENSTGKEKCVRVFFVGHFIDNDGNQYETEEGDVTLAEVDDKGRGHYIVVSLKAKGDSPTFAHELGHIFGLQHNDDKDGNLMSSSEEGSELNKDQMRTAREGAEELLEQPTETPILENTPTPSPSPSPTVAPTKTPQPQQTRHVTLRCVRTSSGQKVTGTAVVTEKKADQPVRVRLEVSCNSNTNPVVRTSYSISMTATKNVQLDVTVDSRSNTCSFTGFSATDPVSVSCTASPEGLELTESDTPEDPDDGDANKDGTTDSIDAALILQFVAGLTDPWPNSDTNENGITNAIDAALVLQFSAGLVPSLPV